MFIASGLQVRPAASAQAMLADLAQAQPARPEATLALRQLDAAAP